MPKICYTFMVGGCVVAAGLLVLSVPDLEAVVYFNSLEQPQGDFRASHRHNVTLPRFCLV